MRLASFASSGARSGKVPPASRLEYPGRQALSLERVLNRSIAMARAAGARRAATRRSAEKTREGLIKSATLQRKMWRPSHPTQTRRDRRAAHRGQRKDASARDAAPRAAPILTKNRKPSRQPLSAAPISTKSLRTATLPRRATRPPATPHAHMDVIGDDPDVMPGPPCPIAPTPADAPFDPSANKIRRKEKAPGVRVRFKRDRFRRPARRHNLKPVRNLIAGSTSGGDAACAKRVRLNPDEDNYPHCRRRSARDCTRSRSDAAEKKSEPLAVP